MSHLDPALDCAAPHSAPLRLSTRSLIGGGTCLAARYALGTLVSMGNMLVLTWWIGPHAYGVFVTAIGLVAFASTLSRVGVDMYLVRRETPPDRATYATATGVTLAASAGLALLAAALVPVLVSWYGSREFALPYLVLLVNIPVTGLIGVPTAKLERELRFNKVAAIELSAQTIGFLIALTLAWIGCGLWAAVAGQLAWQTFTLIAVVRASGLGLTPQWDWHEARPMLRYGLAVTASMRSWQLRTLVNPLLVARFGGPEAVAFVALAIRIAEAIGSIRLAAGRLAIAALARIQDQREEFRRLLERALFFQVVTLGPLLVLFALLGPVIVPRMLGPRWLPILAVYAFVAAGVLINSVFNLQASALFVVGRPWTVMCAFVAHAALLAGGAAWFVPAHGIVGYGWAELLACAAYLLIHLATRRTTHLCYSKLLPFTAAFLALLFAPGVKIVRASPHTQPRTNAIPPSFFGMHFRLDKIVWPAVPFGSLRLWDTDTRWQNLNPAHGVFDFSTLDKYLAAAKEHAVTDVLLTLGGTPQWASADPANFRCDYSEVAPGACAPPADLKSDGSGPNQYWRDYLYALGAHLKSLPPNFSPITYFSVWNEFTRGRESKRWSWIGTNEQLVRMSADVSCILAGRAVGGAPCDAESMHVPAVALVPQSKVVSPDAVPVTDLARIRAYFATPNAVASTDIVAVHAYAYGGPGATSPENQLSGIGKLWENTRAALSQSARALPVWSTEGSWGDTNANLPDPDLQMAYIARYYLLGWSVGFDRLYWYAADNSWGRLIYPNGMGGCRDFGLRKGCSTRAAAAFAQVYRWMVGKQMNVPCTATGSVWTCGLTKADGTKMLAVWDTSQSCSAGSCTSSAYNYSSEYTRYFTLDDATPHPLSGRTVQVGLKPILLIP